MLLDLILASVVIVEGALLHGKRFHLDFTRRRTTAAATRNCLLLHGGAAAPPMMLPPLQPLCSRGPPAPPTATAPSRPWLVPVPPQLELRCYNCLLLRMGGGDRRHHLQLLLHPLPTCRRRPTGAPVLKWPTAVALASLELYGVAGHARTGGSAASWRASKRASGKRAGRLREQFPARTACAKVDTH